MTTNRLVRDYKGDLVPKNKTRSILGKNYVENESCFQMPDGLWYRITSTDKILFDHYQKKYVLKETSKLKKGIINAQGEMGSFSENDFSVSLKDSNSGGAFKECLNAKIAEDLGYMEAISDGIFYKKSNLTTSDLKEWVNKKNIPQHERSSDYNLESNQGKKQMLEESYKNLEIKISPMAKSLSKYLGKMSFGAEFEVINGFLPKHIRSKYGVKALKDGSLRYDGGEGLEFVTVPMSGAKGIQVVKEICNELSKRCEVNNLCSVHYHFGNVRKDKLYVLSLYRLMELLQNELVTYFPYSRINSIKADGKIYCNKLSPLGINYKEILACKDEDAFSRTVANEFNKLYKWLNHGKGLTDKIGEDQIIRTTAVINGKKMFADKWLRNIYTTKSIHHSVEGQKWNRNERYVLLNFLNLFFSKMGTVEFRLAEATTNSTKALIWLVTSAAIVKYAEKIRKCLGTDQITLKMVLEDQLSQAHADYIMAYFKMRNGVFFKTDGSYKEYKAVEKKWFADDADFSFRFNDTEIK